MSEIALSRIFAAHFIQHFKPKPAVRKLAAAVAPSVAAAEPGFEGEENGGGDCESGREGDGSLDMPTVDSGDLRCVSGGALVWRFFPSFGGQIGFPFRCLLFRGGLEQTSPRGLRRLPEEIDIRWEGNQFVRIIDRHSPADGP